MVISNYVNRFLNRYLKEDIASIIDTEMEQKFYSERDLEDLKAIKKILLQDTRLFNLSLTKEESPMQDPEPTTTEADPVQEKESRKKYSQKVCKNLSLISEYLLRSMEDRKQKLEKGNALSIEYAEAYSIIESTLQEFLPKDRDAIFKFEDEEVYLVVHFKGDEPEYTSKLYHALDEAKDNFTGNFTSSSMLFMFKKFRGSFVEVTV
jgi:hypothetical protein